MNIEYTKGTYSFDSRHFSVDGTDFELVGVDSDRFGNIIDTVKNIKTGKYQDIERGRLARIILNENDNKC